ncbi:hypothetical protein [Reinekea blandensis]|nr:hypothetical protein [Reinekea blandensis]
MSLQIAFLLTFLAGGVSVWLLLRMSGQVEKERMAIINNKVHELGGSLLRSDLVSRQNCSFQSEYSDPDFVYKFYKIAYKVGTETKECWAILEMKQRSFGPGGAIQANWIWRF